MLRAWITTELFIATTIAIGCGADDGGGATTSDTTDATSAAADDVGDDGSGDDDGDGDDGSGESGDEGDDGDDTGGGEPSWPEYDANPFVFELDFPVLPGIAGRGALFVHEIDGDGLYDFVVTGVDNLAVYDH